MNAVLKTKQTQFVGVQTHTVKLESKVSMIEKSFIVKSEKEESGTREPVTSKGIRYPVNPGGARTGGHCNRNLMSNMYF